MVSWCVMLYCGPWSLHLQKLEICSGLVGNKLLNACVAFNNPMQQASSKWISQASSVVHAVIHASHVVLTFLTFDNPRNLVYFDW